MASKGAKQVVKGSLFMGIGYVIFRIGGYIYRLIMALLLGAEGYGLLGLTLTFQGILQTLSAGGLPPAIAKYVAQYKALDQDEMATQVVYTSLKVMVALGLFFSMVIFFSAPWLANTLFHNPLAQYPFQAVALITPFSVIVGAFRGAFQGAQRMEYIVYTRAAEQGFMIASAIVLVMLGFYAAGAVTGTAIGFMMAAIVSSTIFHTTLKTYFPSISEENKLSIREELSLAKQLLKFSIPVILTSLSEMAIYDIGPWIIGIFMTVSAVGYYTSADPIARLPLMISLAVSSALLPAASEAASLKNKKLLDNYVIQSYRYVSLLVLPMCVGICVFSKTLLQYMFPTIFQTASALNITAIALSILVMGMTFYTIFMITSSIIQGIGYPNKPMFVLGGGTVLNLILNIVLVYYMDKMFHMGLVGAALATAIAAFVIMVVIVHITRKKTGTEIPYGALGRIILSGLVMGLVIYFIPQTLMGLICAVIIAPIVYIVLLIVFKALNHEDINVFRGITRKLGPLSSVADKLLNKVDSYL